MATVCDFYRRPLLRIEGGQVREISGLRRYSYTDTEVRAFSGELLYRIEGNTVKDFYRRALFTFDGKTVREISGVITHKFDGSLISDFYGKILYRIDSPLSHAGLCVLFLLIRSGELK